MKGCLGRTVMIDTCLAHIDWPRSKNGNGRRAPELRGIHSGPSKPIGARSMSLTPTHTIAGRIRAWRLHLRLINSREHSDPYLPTLPKDIPAVRSRTGRDSTAMR